jgi:8-oxo-dGTP diphosphatase
MDQSSKPQVRVGVAVLIRKENMFLFGKRKSLHGQGMWAPPGGHLEFGEEWEDCAKREVKEETSLVVDNVRLLSVTNDIHHSENRHYVTLFMLCDYESGQAKVMEPEKCEEWKWVEWDNLPRPLFLPVENLLKQKLELLHV